MARTQGFRQSWSTVRHTLGTVPLLPAGTKGFIHVLSVAQAASSGSSLRVMDADSSEVYWSVTSEVTVESTHNGYASFPNPGLPFRNGLSISFPNSTMGLNILLTVTEGDAMWLTTPET